MMMKKLTAFESAELENNCRSPILVDLSQVAALKRDEYEGKEICYIYLQSGVMFSVWATIYHVDDLICKERR